MHTKEIPLFTDKKIKTLKKKCWKENHNQGLVWHDDWFLMDKERAFQFCCAFNWHKISEPKKMLPWTVNYGSLGDSAICRILSTWLLFSCQKTSFLVHKWKRNNISLKISAVIFVVSNGKWKCVCTSWVVSLLNWR